MTLKTKPGKCDKHGDTTIYVLKGEEFRDDVEVCRACLDEEIERVNEK